MVGVEVGEARRAALRALRSGAAVSGAAVEAHAAHAATRTGTVVHPALAPAATAVAVLPALAGPTIAGATGPPGPPRWPNIAPKRPRSSSGRQLAVVVGVERREGRVRQMAANSSLSTAAVVVGVEQVEHDAGAHRRLAAGRRRAAGCRSGRCRRRRRRRLGTVIAVEAASAAVAMIKVLADIAFPSCGHRLFDALHRQHGPPQGALRPPTLIIGHPRGWPAVVAVEGELARADQRRPPGAGDRQRDGLAVAGFHRQRRVRLDRAGDQRAAPVEGDRIVLSVERQVAGS